MIDLFTTMMRIKLVEFTCMLEACWRSGDAEGVGTARSEEPRFNFGEMSPPSFFYDASFIPQHLMKCILHLTMLLHQFSSLIMSLGDNVTELLGKGVNQSSNVVQSRPSTLAAELSNETNGLPIAHTISILLTAMLQPDPRCAPTNPPLTTPTCPL